MGGPASSITRTKAHERTAMLTAQHPPKVWERFVDEVLIKLLIVV